MRILEAPLLILKRKSSSEALETADANDYPVEY